MNNFKKDMNKSIIVSVIVFLLGLVIFIKPDITIKSIAIIIGTLLIIMGSGPIINLIKSEEKKITFAIAPSVILFVIAFILFFSPELLISIIPILMGIAFIMISAYKLQSIYNLKKSANVFNIWTLVITLVILTLGLVLLVNPFKGAIAITKLIGIILIIYAVLDITDNVILKKITKIENNDAN